MPVNIEARALVSAHSVYYPDIRAWVQVYNQKGAFISHSAVEMAPAGTMMNLGWCVHLKRFAIFNGSVWVVCLEWKDLCLIPKRL